MVGYIMDLAIVTVLLVGITAMMGSIAGIPAIKFFSRNQASEFVDQGKKVQTGWKQVGGKGK